MIYMAQYDYQIPKAGTELKLIYAPGSVRQE